MKKFEGTNFETGKIAKDTKSSDIPDAIPGCLVCTDVDHDNGVVTFEFVKEAL